MILSNGSLHEALDAGRLVIEPEPQPRHKVGSGLVRTKLVPLAFGSVTRLILYQQDIFLPDAKGLRGKFPCNK
jgi:hypothetical protein